MFEEIIICHYHSMLQVRKKRESVKSDPLKIR